MRKFSFYKIIYVVIGIVFTLVACKVYYDATIKNNQMGFFVVEGSYADNYLKSTHPADINYIDEDKKVTSDDKFEYVILADGTLSLNAHLSENKALVIPEEIGNRKVSVINFNGKYRKVVIPESVKAITGNIEVTNKIWASQLSVLTVFVVALLMYITVIISATKHFNLNVSFTSLLYLLIPIVYVLSTKKYLVIDGRYDYTYMGLMLATTIVYLIIVSIMVGYAGLGTTSEVPGKLVKERTKKKAPAKKTTTTEKTTTTKKKTTAKKK